MTSQDHTRKDANSSSPPKSDTAETVVEPSEIRRELSDQEIAGVAGGTLNFAKIKQEW